MSQIGRNDENVVEMFDPATEALMEAAGSSDESILGHSERVTNLSIELGIKLGLTNEQLTDLRHAARLHDIGKIGISRDIVNKLGKLTDEEFSVMKLHSVIGIRILEKIEGLRGALPMIKHHHERWDGKGYPDKLSGEDIPLGARIIAVTEAYDIMTSEVPWKPGISEKRAVDELLRSSGSQFDSLIVEVFVEEVLGHKKRIQKSAA